MGALSPSQTIIRYQVENINEAVVPAMVLAGLKANAMPVIPDEYKETIIGWVPFESPYIPDFVANPFLYNGVSLFSLRIDKKTVPPKVLQQQMAISFEKRKTETGREFLSKNEKAEIRELLYDSLLQKTSCIPSVFDFAWDHDLGLAYFYTAQKAAIEVLENLFYKSFECRLVRTIPYTQAACRMTEADEDRLAALTPIKIGD